MQLHREEGTTLTELLVGSLIAVIALGAIVALQIAAYRSSGQDTARFEAQSEAGVALEKVVKDLRMASAVTFTEGGTAIELKVGAPTVRYWQNGSQVIRSEGGRDQVIGNQVEVLSFYSENGGRTVRVEWIARLPNGTAYVLTSSASPRVRR